MITISVCLLLVVVLTAWVIRSEGWPDEPMLWILASMMFGVACFVALLVGTALASGIGSMLPSQRDTHPSRVAELAGLRSNDGVSGQWYFLGTGHLNTHLYYFWYEQAAGGITPRQRAAGVGTYVYEEDRTTAEVRVFEWHFTNTWWRWFALENFGQTWEFHVPKGTVKQGYSL